MQVRECYTTQTGKVREKEEKRGGKEGKKEKGGGKGKGKEDKVRKSNKREERGLHGIKPQDLEKTTTTLRQTVSHGLKKSQKV